jgi:hypothetical protein
MRYQSIKQIAGLGLVFAALAFPSLSRADYTVESGWDLFSTLSAQFQNVPFLGVPLGTFDFGGSIGVQDVGNVDTIMHRPTDIIGSSGGTVGFTATLVALQLRSVSQVDFGAGLGYYYITLQSDHGGPVSTDTGSMYFATNNAGGTFTDELVDYVDVRYGSLTGSIVYTGSCVLTNDGANWFHTDETSDDFWTPYVDHHNIVSRDFHIVPEPSVCSLAVCLGGGLMGLWRMRRKLLRK